MIARILSCVVTIAPGFSWVQEKDTNRLTPTPLELLSDAMEATPEDEALLNWK